MSRSFGARSLTTSAADLQLAVGDVLEARHHSQRGRFARPRRADDDHQLAVMDVEVEVLDGFEAVGIALGDIVELDLGHLCCRSFPLSLHGARRQPSHDPALEQQHEQHHRHRHDDRRGGDVADTEP